MTEWAHDWHPWFAWYPVRLLTTQWAWFRMVRYRKNPKPSKWSYGGYDYAWPE